MFPQKPNFFIVGTAKAGTTSIYSYLKNHPQIHMCPIKEPNYFASDVRLNEFRAEYRKSVDFNVQKYLSAEYLEEKHIAFIENKEEYLQLFREATDQKIVAEISNTYLFSKDAAKKIHSFNPQAKILIILRNPVHRALSHYRMDFAVGRNNNTNPFEAIMEDYHQKNKGWGISNLYIELGMYYEQVYRYMKIFNNRQIKILLYEDYKKDNSKVLKEITDFLDIEDIYSENMNNILTNETTAFKFQFLKNIQKNKILRDCIKCIPTDIQRLLKKFLKQRVTATALLPGEYDMLMHLFQKDLDFLEKYIDFQTKWN